MTHKITTYTIEYKMVLIGVESTFIGKRPSIMKSFQGKTKMLEIFQKGMMIVEEPQPTTEEVSTSVVFSEKEEAELKRMFDSK
jgi:hypothetical protein